jgi:hypothetical protein
MNLENEVNFQLICLIELTQALLENLKAEYVILKVNFGGKKVR